MRATELTVDGKIYIVLISVLIYQNQDFPVEHTFAVCLRQENQWVMRIDEDGSPVQKGSGTG
jgi:hypothetical protein